MAREFKLPDLGSGLKEGEIVRWLVEVGQEVTTDDLLCEVETEKAVIEVPVPYDGTVLSLAAPAGEVVQVGAVLAVFGEAGESAADAASETRPEPDAAEETAPAAAPTVAASPAITQANVAAAPLRAMPAVRRLAAEHDIDITALNGTGRDGRVTKKDVLLYLKNPVVPAAVPALGAQTVATATERVVLSKLRKTIAERMAQSWREIPHIFTRIEADATGLLAARRSLSDVYGRKVPVEALLIRAVLPALKAHPEFNATLDGDALLLHRHYNVSLAVDTPEGLVLPTVHGADRFGMESLVDHVADLLPRAIERKASAQELSGGTFTVNNIGALGNIRGTSIIPYGTTAILSVCRATEKPVVHDGEIRVRPMMEVTLSFAHRVIDGGLAQKFLNVVQQNLEDAVRLLA
ncbi:MAG: 2-oxo acid dehydrogenase subunit E2 [Xanthomonadales bacterium]|nr:2-oxo acid dehydrogenase subunit E2 [Xanthomonadales bacterium]